MVTGHIDSAVEQCLNSFNPELLDHREGRIAITKYNPMLFGMIYLEHHLKIDESFTFSEFHLEVFEAAKEWPFTGNKLRQHRDAYVAPRDSGKSTLNFLVLPLWAAAHLHRHFIAAFSDTATQAEIHLSTFRKELDGNDLLQSDFPELCTAARRANGSAEADNSAMYIAKSGFVFAARGADTKSLGLKVGQRRPDLLILDDIEPGEENYSADLKDKRLKALLQSILPLNERARVVLVGTVTMPDSIVHELVRSHSLPEEAPDWISEQNFVCHYFPAIITDAETGERRSIWPEKWSLEYLESIEGTREFFLNFMNDPMGREGNYWTKDTIQIGTLHVLTQCVLSIDPAVTATKKSDYTACAVVAAQPAQWREQNALEKAMNLKLRRNPNRLILKEPKRAIVRYAVGKKIQIGEPMRDWVLQLIEDYPEIAAILIETNQGMDTWRSVLHDMPRKLVFIRNHLPKDARAGKLAARYQVRRYDVPEVIHEKKMPQAEGQLVGFPKAPYDDIVDAIGNGVAALLGKSKTKAPPNHIRSRSYVGNDGWDD